MMTEAWQWTSRLGLRFLLTCRSGSPKHWGRPQWTGLGGNGFLLALLTDEETVRELRPDIAGISQLSVDVVVVTAKAESGREYDFVSRVFAPKIGLNEDPVTGSAHTMLAPYWTGQLAWNTLTGLQASGRSGLVGVQTSTDRVIVSGRAVTIVDGILTPHRVSLVGGSRAIAAHPLPHLDR